MMRNFNRGQGGRMGGKGGGMGRGKGGMKNRGQGSMMGGQGGMMGGQGSMMGGQGGMMGGQGGMRGQGGMGGQGCMMGGQGDMMGGQGDMMGGQGGMMGGQGGMGGHGGMMGGQDGMMGDQGGMMGGQGGMMEGQGGMMGGQGDMMGGQTGMNMMTNQSFGGGGSNQMADNRQTAFVELIQKQSEVIEKLASRVGITNEVKMGAGPMQMGPRGRGGPGMMGPRGHAMGMRGDGPRGPMMPGPFGGMGGGPSGPFQGGPRGPGPFQGGPRGPFYGGPRGPGPFQGGPRGPFQGGNEMNDPKFLKTCQIYLDTMKKNVPSNEDKLSGFCVICSHQSKNNQGFFNHRKNEMHLRQEARIAEMPEKIRRQIDKVVNELYALREKHKYLMYCAVCEEKLPVPYSDHKNMITHTTKARATRAGCRTCKTGPMKTYKQFREHCYTETHIQAAEKFDKKMEDAVEVKDLPPFQDGVVYVKGYIEPTSGYYCSLCRKFLRDDAEMEVHVRLERHFNHVKDEYYNKRKSDTIDWVDYTPVEEEEEEEDGADKTNGSAANEAAMTEEDGKEAKEEEDMETTEQD
ncbi:spidroin-1-like isoform X2 [Haliotis rufescens]|uniref:spidroin-1-like isoform X2 n=1 Tax=Haliotis rufescens TaxID=6454 RepID=UPI00201FA5A1|nr:spidroin-1-like isoform X2 [Haliotis rufescens]